MTFNFFYFFYLVCFCFVSTDKLLASDASDASDASNATPETRTINRIQSMQLLSHDSHHSFSLSMPKVQSLGQLDDYATTIAFQGPEIEDRSKKELVQVNQLIRSMIVHVRASASSYDDEGAYKSFFGFEHHSSFEIDDFRGVTFLNSNEKSLIIALRGTVNRNNWIFNASHIVGSHFYDHSLTQAPLLAVCMGVSCALVSKFPSTQRSIMGFMLSSFLFWEIQHNRKKAYERFITSTSYVKSLKHLDCCIKRLIDEFGSDHSIEITGHSLGGFLAQHFALKHSLSGSSYNAPPLGTYCTSKEEINRYIESSNNFENYRISGDLISSATCKEHLGQQTTYSILELSESFSAGQSHGIENFSKAKKISSVYEQRLD